MIIWTWKKWPKSSSQAFTLTPPPPPPPHLDNAQMQVQLFIEGLSLSTGINAIMILLLLLLISGRDLMKRSHRLPLVVGQHQSPAGGVPAEDHLHHRHWHLHSGLCAHFQLFHAHHCHFQYYRHGQQENDEILTFLFQNNIEELSPCHRQTQPVLTHLQETWQ